MRLIVKRGLDLRLKQEDRIFHAEAQSLVVLVNNAHTIAHGILGEDPDLLIRVRLPSYLKGTADPYLAKFIKSKLHWLLATRVLTVPPPIPRESEFSSKRSYAYHKRHRRF